MKISINVHGHTVSLRPDSDWKNFTTTNDKYSFSLISHQSINTNWFEDFDFSKSVLNMQSTISRKLDTFILILTSTDGTRVIPDFVTSTKLFYGVSGDEGIISTKETDLLQSPFISKKLNLETIKNFVLLGYAPEGKTFFFDISKFPLGGGLYFKNSHFQITTLFTSSNYQQNRIESYNECLDLYEQTINSCVKSFLELGSTDVLGSGGADTRLLLASLLKNKAQNILITTVCSPALGKKKDRDVLIVEDLAQETGFQFKVLEPNANNYRYSLGAKKESPYSMGGLYGGEFLGGTVLDFIPKPYSAHDYSRIKSVFKSSDDFELNISDHPLLEHSGPFSYLNPLSIKIMMNSYRSTIYNSFWGSWSAPYSLPTLTLSLFTQEKFIQLILNTPFEYLENYSLYSDLLTGPFKNLSHIPFSSPIKKGSLISQSNKGIDPKTIARHDMSHFLEKLISNDKVWSRGIWNKEECCQLLSTDKQFATRFLNIEFWFWLWEKWDGWS